MIAVLEPINATGARDAGPFRPLDVMCIETGAVGAGIGRGGREDGRFEVDGFEVPLGRGLAVALLLLLAEEGTDSGRPGFRGSFLFRRRASSSFTSSRHRSPASNSTLTSFPSVPMPTLFCCRLLWQRLSCHIVCFVLDPDDAQWATG